MGFVKSKVPTNDLDALHPPDTREQYDFWPFGLEISPALLIVFHLLIEFGQAARFRRNIVVRRDDHIVSVEIVRQEVAVGE